MHVTYIWLWICVFTDYGGFPGGAVILFNVFFGMCFLLSMGLITWVHHRWNYHPYHLVSLIIVFLFCLFPIQWNLFSLYLFRRSVWFFGSVDLEKRDPNLKRKRLNLRTAKIADFGNLRRVVLVRLSRMAQIITSGFNPHWISIYLKPLETNGEVLTR